MTSDQEHVMMYRKTNKLSANGSNCSAQKDLVLRIGVESMVSTEFKLDTSFQTKCLYDETSGPALGYRLCF